MKNFTITAKIDGLEKSFNFSYETALNLECLKNQFKAQILELPLDKQQAVADDVKTALNKKIRSIVLDDILNSDNIVAELLKQRTIPKVKADKDSKGGKSPNFGYKSVGKSKRVGKEEHAIFVTFAELARYAEKEKSDKVKNLFNLSQLEYFRRFGGNVWNICDIGDKVTVTPAQHKELAFFNSTEDSDIKKQLQYCFTVLSNSAKLDKPLFATKGRVNDFKYFAIDANVFTMTISMFGENEIDVISLLIAYASQLAKDKTVATICGIKHEEPQQEEQPNDNGTAEQPQQETPKAPQQGKKGSKKA